MELSESVQKGAKYRGTATNAERAIQISEADVHGEDFDAPLTFFGLVVLKIASRSTRTGQCGWALFSILFVLAEVVCLQAIALTSSWQPCNTLDYDDCRLGQACVLLTHYYSGDFEATRATCKDCFDLTQADPPAWAATARLPRAYTGPASNASDFCWRSLPLWRTRAGLDFPDDFEKCLFVQSHFSRLSSLEIIVISIAFFIVTASIVNERMQQLCVHELRRWLLPARCKVPLRWLLVMSEIGATHVMLASVPYVLVTLIVTMGMDATSVLLNGVAIAFVLGMDDLAMAQMLSFSEQVKFKALFKLTSERYNLHHFRSHKFAAQARGFCSVVAMTVSLIVASNSRCEELVTHLPFICSGMSWLASVAETLILHPKRSLSHWMHTAFEVLLGFVMQVVIFLGMVRIYYLG